MKKGLLIVVAMVLFGLGSTAYGFKADGTDQQKKGGQHEILQVKNFEGRQIGTVGKALVNDGGQILFLIVSLDRPKGGKKEIIVPVTSFTPDEKDGTLQLNMSNELLAAAPEFNPSSLDDPSYFAGILRFYAALPEETPRTHAG